MPPQTPCTAKSHRSMPKSIILWWLFCVSQQHRNASPSGDSWQRACAGPGLKIRDRWGDASDLVQVVYSWKFFEQCYKLDIARDLRCHVSLCQRNSVACFHTEERHCFHVHWKAMLSGQMSCYQPSKSNECWQICSGSQHFAASVNHVQSSTAHFAHSWDEYTCLFHARNIARQPHDHTDTGQCTDYCIDYNALPCVLQNCRAPKQKNGNAAKFSQQFWQ